MHAHTHPNPQFMVMAETFTLAFSVAEMSVAEISGPKRPRPKYPPLKLPTCVDSHTLTYFLLMSTRDASYINF